MRRGRSGGAAEHRLLRVPWRLEALDRTAPATPGVARAERPCSQGHRDQPRRSGAKAASRSGWREREEGHALPFRDLRRVHRPALRRQPARGAARSGGPVAGWMQRIAAEFNYSETTFVVPPADPATWHRSGSSRPGRDPVRRPSPSARRWSWRLARPGAGRGRDRARGGAGPVPVRIAADGHGGAIAASSPHPWRRATAPTTPAEPVAAALGLSTADLVTDAAACPASPLAARRSSSSSWPVATPWRVPGSTPQRTCRMGGNGVFLFTREPGDARPTSARACSRPSTASPRTRPPAAPPPPRGLPGQAPGLADGWHRWRIVQGVEMGRPSLIEASAPPGRPGGRGPGRRQGRAGRRGHDRGRGRVNDTFRPSPGGPSPPPAPRAARGRCCRSCPAPSRSASSTASRRRAGPEHARDRALSRAGVRRRVAVPGAGVLGRPAAAHDPRPQRADHQPAARADGPDPRALARRLRPAQAYGRLSSS